MKIHQRFNYVFLIYPFSLLITAVIFYYFKKDLSLFNTAIYIVVLYYIIMSISFYFELKKKLEN